VRGADGALLRLRGQCLHVGVRDGEAVLEPELGPVQGAVLSPFGGNVYLHDVLDRWFDPEVKPRLGGKATLIRYCDDGDVSQVLIPDQTGCPNSYRLMKSPITRSCMRSVLEKHIVRRTSRLIRVRRWICLLSIFCVFSLPT
jgi:hypothetical protein